MNKEERKQLTAQYMEQERVMGVYQITNTASGRRFIGSTSNMDGALNRVRFELDFGTHKNDVLQMDWNEQGAAQFEFDILEKMKLEEKVLFDYKDVNPAEQGGTSAEQMRKYKKATEELEQKWLEKLLAEGVDCYNELE